jgi:tetratricopeptide (TPR) repeat protein
MLRLVLVCLVMGLVLLPGLPGLAQAGSQQDLMASLVKSYDLLEAGKLAQAKKVYEDILARYPDNPLALNNLGAIYVKEQDYSRGLDYLERALPRAKGYKVLVNRVCDMNRICLAFRPGAVEYGNQDLEPLIALNIAMVKAKIAAGQKGK